MFTRTDHIGRCPYCHSTVSAFRRDGERRYYVGCDRFECPEKPHFYVSLIKGQSILDIMERIIDLWNSGTFVTGTQMLFDGEPTSRIYKIELSAWLEGEQIQYRYVKGGNWKDYDRQDKVPQVDQPDFEWRIKPRCDVFYGALVWRGNVVPVMEMPKKTRGPNDNVKMTFESGELAGIELLSKDGDSDCNDE